VKTYLREFERFGFEKGGTVEFYGTTDPASDASSTKVLICTNEQFTKIINDGEDGTGTGGVCKDSTKDVSL
jgi:hypothetical protein